MKKAFLAGLMATLLAVTPVFADTTIVNSDVETMTEATTVDQETTTNDTEETTEIDDNTAEETVVITVDPGITPDSILYAVDTLIEDIQLALTSFNEKKAEIMLKIAEERQAEADEMASEEKLSDASKALEGYADILEKVQEIIGEIVLSDETTETIKEALVDDLKDVIEAIEETEIVVEDEELMEEIEEKIDNGYLVANVVKGLDVEKVKQIRIEQKLGYGVIAKVFMMADASGKSVDEIAALFNDGKGYGEVVKELGLHPSQIKGKSKEKAIEPIETEVNDENNTDEPTSAAEIKTAVSPMNKETVKAEKKIKTNNKKETVKVDFTDVDDDKDEEDDDDDDHDKASKENKGLKVKKENNGKKKD